MSPPRRVGICMCHAASRDEPQKGPYLGNTAQTYSHTDLAENILDPGKSIARGSATELFTLKDGTVQMGCVTFESAVLVKARNIEAQEFSWKPRTLSSVASSRIP